ncbi:uncharacterized protein LOC133846076, partial [Drosophila sulfurigaster albostrigata]|uniref:uncharacterized protein LOC133846076 n=1 Tax=Drosophila sulfurigaster albostrigata TaxID=89887 RepID=UPI002D21E064
LPQQAVVFKFSNAVCETYNESWFLIHKCRIRAVKRNINTFNFNGTVLHPAYDISINGQLFKKANGYKPWLFKASIDGCQFIKRAYNPAAILIFNLFKEYTNFNHSCPYNGTQLVKGFYLRPELLKLPIPSGDYLLSLTWLFDKRPQFVTNIYFVFEEDL